MKFILSLRYLSVVVLAGSVFLVLYSAVLVSKGRYGYLPMPTGAVTRPTIYS